MFALQMLARIGDPAAVPAVLPLIRHPRANIAQSAIEALGRLRSREAVPDAARAAGRRALAPAGGHRRAGRHRRSGGGGAAGRAGSRLDHGGARGAGAAAARRPGLAGTHAGPVPPDARAEPPGRPAARDRRGARSSWRSRTDHPRLGRRAAARSGRRGHGLSAAGADRARPRATISTPRSGSARRPRWWPAPTSRPWCRSCSRGSAGPTPRIGPRACSGRGPTRCAPAWISSSATPTPGCGGGRWWRWCPSQEDAARLLAAAG